MTFALKRWSTKTLITFAWVRAAQAKDAFLSGLLSIFVMSVGLVASQRLDFFGTNISSSGPNTWRVINETPHLLKLTLMRSLSHMHLADSDKIIDEWTADYAKLESENALLQKVAAFASGDGWNELPKLRAENARLRDHLKVIAMADRLWNCQHYASLALKEADRE